MGALTHHGAQDVLCVVQLEQYRQKKAAQDVKRKPPAEQVPHSLGPASKPQKGGMMLYVYISIVPQCTSNVYWASRLCRALLPTPPVVQGEATSHNPAGAVITQGDRLPRACTAGIPAWLHAMKNYMKCDWRADGADEAETSNAVEGEHEPHQAFHDALEDSGSASGAGALSLWYGCKVESGSAQVPRLLFERGKERLVESTTKALPIESAIAGIAGNLVSRATDMIQPGDDALPKTQGLVARVSRALAQC